MATPSSAATAYATTADWSKRHDVRVLAQLASDTDYPIGEDAASLAASARLSTCLRGASGEVEAACMAGRRYTPEILAQLTGVSLEFLKDIVCNQALIRLYRARPDVLGPVPPLYTEYQQQLARLNSGEWVFGIIESQKASNISNHVERASEVEARNLVVVQARRMFGRRGNRLNRYP